MMKLYLIHPRWQKLPLQNEFNLPPLGMIAVAACAPAGVEVIVCNENVQPVDLQADCNLVGISILLTAQAPRGYQLAAEFRARGKKVILGGLHVTLLPEEASAHADAICIGEAEGLMEQAMADFMEGRLQKVYRRDGFPDMARVGPPRRSCYDKKAHYTYKGWEMVDLVETSRGCRFGCYPCCVPHAYQGIHRVKPWELVAQDLAACHDLVFIVDNSLEQDPEYERQLFTNLKQAGKRWISHPISPEPELLTLARESGCWYVYHAIFDISDKIKQRVRLYHDHGIKVEGTILLGMDHHDEDFILRLIDFLLTINLDLAEFTVLTPFPQTKAHEQMNKEGRIFDHDWAHYNAATVVHQPLLIKPERLQELYYQAWEAFYGQTSQNLRMTKLLMEVLRETPRAGRRRGAGAAGQVA